MFTWICPQCGREVAPHETECPYCREQAAAAGQAPAGERPESARSGPPPRPAVSLPSAAATPPPSAVPPSAPAAAPPQPVYEVGGRQGMPPWVVTLLVAVALFLAGGGFYYWVWPALKARPVARQQSPFEEVLPAGEAHVTGGRIARYIEVTGFRITEDANRRAQVRFLVVNHSAADIGDLAGKVSLRTTKSSPDEPPISTFEFKTSRLGPYESVEFKTVMATKLRAYELPDWQFLTADVEITSPKDL